MPHGRARAGYIYIFAVVSPLFSVGSLTVVAHPGADQSHISLVSANNFVIARGTGSRS